MKIRNIIKTFGDGKTAVDGVSINLYKDEIFALLGHNGAGKSTLISILSGLYEATSGEAYYDGVNVLDDTQMDIFRTKLGICPQHDVLFDDLTIREHLSMFCYFKGVPSEKIEDEINKTLKDFRIEDIQDIIAKNLSAGQRRKLSIAIAIIGGSEVIFLDEPSSGMDITSRRNLWEILKRCTEDKIIILTTHYMEEAADADYVVILDSGKIAAEGTPLALKNSCTGDFITLYGVTEEQVRALGCPCQPLRDAYRLAVPDTAAATELILRHPELFRDYEIIKGRMDDVFLAVTGKKLTGGDEK